MARHFIDKGVEIAQFYDFLRKIGVTLEEDQKKVVEKFFAHRISFIQIKSQFVRTQIKRFRDRNV